MDIKLLHSTYYIQKGEEKIQVTVFGNGKIEIFRIRLLANSDFEKEAIEAAKKIHYTDKK